MPTMTAKATLTPTDDDVFQVVADVAEKPTCIFMQATTFIFYILLFFLFPGGAAAAASTVTATAAIENSSSMRSVVRLEEHA